MFSNIFFLPSFVFVLFCFVFLLLFFVVVVVVFCSIGVSLPKEAATHTTSKEMEKENKRDS